MRTKYHHIQSDSYYNDRYTEGIPTLKRDQILQNESHCPHPTASLIAIEYRGWYDGMVEWACPQCQKRLIPDTEFLLHHDYMRYHPLYGLANLREKTWDITVGTAYLGTSSQKRKDEIRKHADIFLREYLRQYPFTP